jgi:hypothetical protein
MYQYLKQEVEDNVTYKLVANDPLNEPSWIFFINGIIECSLNLCLQYTDGDVFLRFEGLDGMGNCASISFPKNQKECSAKRAVTYRIVRY